MRNDKRGIDTHFHETVFYLNSSYSRIKHESTAGACWKMQ